jgi:hypothetical protein
VVELADLGESDAVAAMGDPHVVYLRYAFAPTNPSIEFRVSGYDVEMDEFTLRVGPAGKGLPGLYTAAASMRPADASDDVGAAPPMLEVAVLFNAHYRSEIAAHESVRSVLEAWELAEQLRRPGRPPRFTFEWAGSCIVDRAPPSGQDPRYVTSAGGRFYVQPATKTVVVEELPPPPHGLASDDHAKTLWTRWAPYVEGADSLAAAAYACLTYVNSVFGPSPRDVATRLRVSRNVLARIAELSSRRGDPATARKFDAQPLRAHSPEEVAFLEQAITALIRRISELATCSNAAQLREIGLADFA